MGDSDMEIRISGSCRLFSILSLPFFILYGCRGGQDDNMGFDGLYAGFAEPPAEYRPVPLWVWNGKETEEEISASVGEMHEAGFGGVFVHPRPGLETEYLSEEWMSLFRHTLKECSDYGMGVWIYDENSYPSGFAGGYVPEQMPESYNQGQGLTLETPEALPDDRGYYETVLLKRDSTYTDITDDLDMYEDSSGSFLAFRKTFNSPSPWNAGFPYVDLMVRGVTEKFIGITLDRYEEELGEMFPEVMGVFSDEPQIESPGGIRWTPDLAGRFEEKWGYSFTEALPMLFREEGDWRKARHDYQSTLLDLFIERWSVPMRDWCSSRGIAWTGHYWEHNWPDLRTGPDNMAMYAFHQMPGVDMLFNQFDEVHPQAQFGNVRAIKELGSIANQMGCRRTLSETYGGAGWDITFMDMKRLGDWEYVLGVNFMNQHLVKMHLNGSRKYDYPPYFSKPNPWWQYYRTQNDYFARLSWALSHGVQENSTVVIEPTTTLWCDYSAAGSASGLWQTADLFQKFVTDLEKGHVEYDLGSEYVISGEGSVNGGVLKVGRCSYTTVVIPPGMENMESSTLSFLEPFLDGGGRIVAFSRPYLLDGRESAELKSFMDDSRIEYCPSWEDAYSSLAAPDIDIKRISGGMFHQRRQFADGQLLFFANPSMESDAVCDVSMKGCGVSALDPFTGKAYSYPSRTDGETSSFQVTLPPAGSLLLFIHSDGGVPSFPPYRNVSGKGVPVISQGGLKVKPDSLNVLYVDFCDLDINGKEYRSIHFADAAHKYFCEAGYGGNPWAESVQFRSSYVKRDADPVRGDVSVTYHVEISGIHDMDGQMFLVVERPGCWTVTVNGTRILPEKGKWWLDRETGVYDLRGLLKDGDNSICLGTGVLSVFAEIEPVYILGDFLLEPSTHGWKMLPRRTEMTSGAWKGQGYPFYSWGVSYSGDFMVEKISSERYEVALDDWNGSVAEVSVNGKHAGIIAYAPYSLDVTDFLMSGENTVAVTVVGSFRNLLGPHHNHPAQGIGGPWEWKNIYGPMPSGESYSLFSYGLYSDFTLLRVGNEDN